MTWYKETTASSSSWVYDIDSPDFKREFIGVFSPEDIKKEVEQPPPKPVYFDPEELVI